MARHQEVNDDINQRAAVLRVDLTHELKLLELGALAVSVLHQAFDKILVFVLVLKGVRVERDVDIERANMGHVLVFEKKPRNGAADDSELAFVAPEDLAHFNEDRFNRRRGAFIVVRRRLGLRFHLLLCHLSFSPRR
jgi:hypothetical protein